jgi:site-specific recombinase XerD
MRVVQEILGHSRLSTTADAYSHVLPTLQREAADRMGALIRETL